MTDPLGTSEQTAPPATGNPPSLWRNRDYVGLWIGDAISSLGTSISSIAYPLLILFSTGSVAQAGVITAASMIGATATTLWGGALADRMSRRALLFSCPLVQAVTVGLVAALVSRGSAGLPMLAATALVGGLAGGVLVGARAPALRRIVPKTQLATATSQMMGRDMAAEFFGNQLGGLLFVLARWLPFATDAVSFVFASIGAILIRRPLGPDTTNAPAHLGMITDIREGLRYVRTVPFLRFMAVWSPLLNVLGGAYFLLFIAVLKQRGAEPTMIGVANGLAMASGVLGAMLGPLVLRKIRARLVFLATGWLFCSATLLTALLPGVWEVALAVCLVTLVIVPLNALLAAYQVRLVPDPLCGRVSASVTFLARALQWVGPLLAGVLADSLSASTATLVCAAAIVPLAVVAHVAPSVRLLNTPVDQVEEHSPDESSDKPPIRGSQGQFLDPR